MRREGLFRPIGTRRWPLVVLGVIALMLLPMQGWARRMASAHPTAAA
jgi:hypothetical protein